MNLTGTTRFSAFDCCLKYGSTLLGICFYNTEKDNSIMFGELLKYCSLLLKYTTVLLVCSMQMALTNDDECKMNRSL